MFGLFKKKLKEGVDLTYLDNESHKRLKELADENYRTLTGQACYIIANYLGTADNWAKEEFQRLTGEPEKRKTVTPVESLYQDLVDQTDGILLDDVLRLSKNDLQPAAPVAKRTRRKKHLLVTSQILAVLEAMHTCNPMGLPLTTNNYLSLTRVMDVITDPSLGKKDSKSPPATTLSSNISYLRLWGYVEAVGKVDVPVKTGRRDTMKQQTYRATKKGKREVIYHEKRRSSRSQTEAKQEQDDETAK